MAKKKRLTTKQKFEKIDSGNKKYLWEKLGYSDGSGRMMISKYNDGKHSKSLRRIIENRIDDEFNIQEFCDSIQLSMKEDIKVIYCDGKKTINYDELMIYKIEIEKNVTDPGQIKEIMDLSIVVLNNLYNTEPYAVVRLIGKYLLNLKSVA